MSEKELQFSLDAIGTIVNTDLPKIQRTLDSAVEELSVVFESIKRQDLAINSISSQLAEVDAKIEVALQKLDLIERRIAEL